MATNFLASDETQGALQVWNTSSQTWMNANPLPGTFVVRTESISSALSTAEEQASQLNIGKM